MNSFDSGGVSKLWKRTRGLVVQKREREKRDIF
jgi:hypothetical protein